MFKEARIMLCSLRNATRWRKRVAMRGKWNGGGLCSGGRGWNRKAKGVCVCLFAVAEVLKRTCYTYGQRFTVPTPTGFTGSDRWRCAETFCCSGRAGDETISGKRGHGNEGVHHLASYSRALKRVKGPSRTRQSLMGAKLETIGASVGQYKTSVNIPVQPPPTTSTSSSSYGSLVETSHLPGSPGCRRRCFGRPRNTGCLPWVQGNKRRGQWVDLDCRSHPRGPGLQCFWDRRPAAEAPGDLRDRYGVSFVVQESSIA